MTEIQMTKTDSFKNLNIRILNLFRISNLEFRILDLNISPPSSSGLGYQVLILETGVRLPLGVVFNLLFTIFYFCSLEKTISHFDRSPRSCFRKKARGRSGEIY